MKIDELIKNKIFTVSEFNDFVNAVLQPLSATVEGEVADFRVSQGKFVWFMLKDAEQALSCFSMAFRIRQPIEDGMKVKISGYPKIYGKSGRYSFFVESIEISGEGSLRRAYELLKAKLEAEGLFAAERKRPLPRFPQTIGLITSRDAAAYTDFTTHLNARMGGLEIKFLPAAVHGKQAVAEILAAFEFFNKAGRRPDVVVLTRGGGSLEDLVAFNSEEIVRAVFSCKVPTVVGVGHERDFSLSELSADTRASTPTHAAQLVVQNRQELLMDTETKTETIKRRLQEKITDRQWVLGHAVRELTDSVAARLEHVRSILREYRLEFNTLARRQTEAKEKLIGLQSLLYSLSPQNVLARGYSIVRKSGTIIKRASDVTAGDTLTIQPGKGTIESKVTGINYDGEKKE
jgi:exodeoxyribonuclease VII large subunit